LRLGFVTSNKGKQKELQTRLSELSHEVVQLSISYPELQADSIDEVARFGLDWINRKIHDETIEIALI
jgi:XTP/dITP diphosphohydrolase